MLRSQGCDRAPAGHGFAARGPRCRGPHCRPGGRPAAPKLHPSAAVRIVTMLAEMENPVLSANAPALASVAQSAARNSKPWARKLPCMALRSRASMQVPLNFLYCLSRTAASTRTKLNPGVVAHDGRKMIATPSAAKTCAFAATVGVDSGGLALKLSFPAGSAFAG